MALKALKTLAPDHINLSIADITDIPPFNPDREDEKILSVDKLKVALSQSDGLIIASPEYAHGISGVLKNTLDWLVSGPEFPYKPIMLVNTSPRASIAQNALKEVLTTMSGILVEESHVAIPLLGSQLLKSGVVTDRSMASSLVESLDIFVTQIKKTTNNLE